MNIENILKELKKPFKVVEKDGGDIKVLEYFNSFKEAMKYAHDLAYKIQSDYNESHCHGLYEQTDTMEIKSGEDYYRLDDDYFLIVENT